ncbi:MAG: 3'-5' exonuclease, partial [Methanoculleus sp.]|nr:3'-5' exonuclease [Methanoculleus sp.]
MADRALESRMSAPTTLEDFGRVRIGIHQVEYSVGVDIPVIHIFGRDVTGRAVRVDVTGFRPYFYAPASQVDEKHVPPEVDLEPGTTYRSIQGEALRRLYTRRPGDVRDVRDRYQHFEADIPFATRFMIDCGLRAGMELPAGTTVIDYRELAPSEIAAPARTCIMDIECVDEQGFPEPER